MLALRKLGFELLLDYKGWGNCCFVAAGLLGVLQHQWFQLVLGQFAPMLSFAYGSGGGR